MRRPSKLITVFAVLAGIFLFLPFLFGLLSQRYATRFLENENNTLGNVLGVHLVFSEYDRGWFSSRAVLQIQKKRMNGDEEIIKDIPITIEHGPFYRYKNTFIGVGLVKIVNLNLSGDFPYDVNFKENIGFSGEHGILLLVANKKIAPGVGAVNIDKLVLDLRSNLRANHFVFRLAADDLQFQNPAQNISVNIKNLDSTLTANFLTAQHWKMILSLMLNDNQLSATLPGSLPTAITLNADEIDVKRVHFDTQEMAKLLSEVVELKQASDTQQNISSTEWVALAQALLVQTIDNDTVFHVKGLSVGTPMGRFTSDYDASFPTLPAQHDYFDIATHNVGSWQVTVPQWQYSNSDNAFSLTGLKYEEKNNTVFSRHSDLQLGMVSIMNTATNKSTLKADDFAYTGDLYGDVSNLSQTMNWTLSNLCFNNDCFSKIDGKLALLKMNFDAFRNIAAATQKVVQFNPNGNASLEDRWSNLTNAYTQLITPKTKIVLSQSLMTPHGELKLDGQATWPGLTQSAAASDALDSRLQTASYELRALLPTAYINSFLDDSQLTSVPASSASLNTTSTSPQSGFKQQAGQFVQYAITQGYLKQVGDAYTLDLVGKGNAITINGVPWKAPTQ